MSIFEELQLDVLLSGGKMHVARNGIIRMRHAWGRSGFGFSSNEETRFEFSSGKEVKVV